MHAALHGIFGRVALSQNVGLPGDAAIAAPKEPLRAVAAGYGKLLPGKKNQGRAGATAHWGLTELVGDAQKAAARPAVRTCTTAGRADGTISLCLRLP